MPKTQVSKHFASKLYIVYYSKNYD